MSAGRSWKAEEDFYGEALYGGERFAVEHERRTDTRKLKC
jgi:hypothetical protein